MAHPKRLGAIFIAMDTATIAVIISGMVAMGALGSVDISTQPNQSASEIQKAQISAGEFVIA